MHSLPLATAFSGSPSTFTSLLSFVYSSTPQPMWQPGGDQCVVRVTVKSPSCHCHSPSW